MLEAGLIDQREQVDPEGFRRFGWSLIWMSKCMVTDPAYMRRGFTRPPAEVPAATVRQHQVTYPGLKGLVLQGFRDPTSPNPIAFCCAGPLIVVPVAMADGSMVLGTRRDFIGGTTPVIIDAIGMPVYATWGGYLARDR